MSLNNSQQLAEKRIVRFLMDSDEKALILNAPSGYGKTFLMNHILQNLNEYRKKARVLGETIPHQMVFGAPTNKAAAIGYGGKTIHKLLNLAPQKNYQTGKTQLTQKEPTMLNVLVADEWSCIDKNVLKYVVKSSKKVIFTGDKHQLPPVNEEVSPVAKLPVDMITLTEPMRQDLDSGLFQMCQHLRSMVEQGKIIKTTLNDDCQYISGSAMQQMLKTHFGPNMDNRIITYTNKKAVAVNTHIRQMYGNLGYWNPGETVTARSSSYSVDQTMRSVVERSYHVTASNMLEETVELDGMLFKVASNPQQVINAISKARRNKDYRTMFALQEEWLDLRAAYAGTCHTVQGSTYDNVFIDLADFSKCRDLNTLVRLLYVAVSRARHKVYFYGKPTFNLF